MAAQRSRKPRILPGRQDLGLIAAGLGASLLISGFLTLSLLPVPGLGSGARTPRVGDISDRDYEAPVAVTIVDEEATEQLRREAIQNAPMVYDFDERRLEALEERLTGAFAAAREATEEKGGDEALGASPGGQFRAALGEEVSVPDAALAYLEETAFDAEDEALLLQIVASVARMIVDDSSEIVRHLQSRNVLVRKLGSGEESKLSPEQVVLTQDGARELIEKEGRVALAEQPRERRGALLAVAKEWVRPNLNVNLRATEEARQAAEAGVKNATISLRQGEIIVRDGDPISARHVLILEGIRAQQLAVSRVEEFLGVAGVLFLLMAVIWRFGKHSLPRFPQAPRDAAFLLSALVATALLTSLGLFVADALAQTPWIASLVESSPGLLTFAIPVAAATLLVRMVHNAETAALFAIFISLLAGLQVDGELSYALYTLAGSLTAAVATSQVAQRGTLLRAGIRVGVANVLAILALGLLGGDPSLGPLALAATLGLAAGGLSGVLVSGMAPVVESVFAYTTDVKLLELANREQPLLRDLELRAPGTYHHSMMVGHLAEKAAEAIGANALLAKVAGYYHDIGKLRRPHFFVENYALHGGEDRHEKLSPSISARILQAHVRDGIEMGDANGLAPPIMQGIREHHGTSIIRFFFEKAKEAADPEKGDVVAEHDYRYPGPKPQTREAGILMLADSVEAASRTLADTSPARVQQLVQRLVNNYFRDGQLDDCSLTLRDLHAIARSFIDTLSAIRHERIDYPEATDSRGKKLEEGGDEGLAERLEPGQTDRPERTEEESEGGIRRLGVLGR
ncbi:MAG: HDIG domain-containing metalloprotein [Myxococcota bacterium]